MAARAGRGQSHQVPSQLDSLRAPMMASVHEVGMSPRCAATPNAAPQLQTLRCNSPRYAATPNAALQLQTELQFTT